MRKASFGHGYTVNIVCATTLLGIETLLCQTGAIKPELVVQTGHNFGLQAVTLSPDGHWFASAGWDRNVKVWDTANGTEIQSFSGPVGFSAVALSPDGRFVAAAATGDRQVHVWDLNNGREKAILRGHGVGAVSFAMNGKLLIGSTTDSHLTVWDVTDGRELYSFSGKQYAITADGSSLALNTSDATIDIYDLASGTSVKHLSITGAPVAFNLTGDRLAVRGPDSVRIWNIAASVVEQTVGNFSPANRPLAMSFDKDLSYMATAHGNDVTLWRVATGERLWTHSAYAGPVSGVPVHVIASLSFHPDGTSLISANWDNTIAYWDVATGITKRLLKHRTDNPGIVALSGDGKWLAYPGNGQPATIWDLASDTGSRKLGGTGGLIVFTPDSRQVLVQKTSTTLMLKDVQTGKDAVEYVESNGFASAAFNADGTLLATTTSARGVRVWDVKSATEKVRLQLPGRRELAGAGPPPRVLGFSPDASALVIFDQMQTDLIVWSLADSRRLPTVKGLESASAAALSADGHWLALADRDQKSKIVRVYDFQTRAIHEVSGYRPLQFSADGSLLATFGGEGLLQVWSTQTGRLIKEIKTPGAYFDAAFTANGAEVLTVTDRGSLSLFELKTASEILTLCSGWAKNEWVVVSPNGLFDGSPSGMQNLLAWKFGSGLRPAMPLEVLFREFYHPGLLSDVLKGNRPTSPRRLDQIDRRQPLVTIALPGSQDPLQHSLARTILARVSVREASAGGAHALGSGVRDLRLFRNGVLVRAWHGQMPLNQHGEAVVETTVSLAPGDNTISAYAFSAANIRSSEVGSALTVKGVSPAPGTVYLLTIGINKYSNQTYNLRYSVPDANLVASALTDSLKTARPTEQVKVISLSDQSATKDNILGVLRALGQGKPRHGVIRATPQDTIFVYFAGHGIAVGSRYYLLPYDYGSVGADRTPATSASAGQWSHAVSDIELKRAFEDIDAGVLALIVDACDSGQALQSTDRLGPLNISTLGQLAYEKGMYVLAAAQRNQAAIESAQFGHGLLTYALLEEGLRNGAADFSPRDGTIDIREWFNFAAMRVPALGRLRQPANRALVHPLGTASTKTAPAAIQQPRVFYRRDDLDREVIIGHRELDEKPQALPATVARSTPVASEVPPAQVVAAQASTTQVPGGPGDGGTLLDEVRKVYRQLKSYQFEARTVSKSMSGVSVVSVLDQRMSIAAIVPSKSRVEIKINEFPPTLQVSDGQYTWQYNQAALIYKQLKLLPLPLQLPPMAVGAANMDGPMAITAEGLIQPLSMAKSARLLKEESVDVGGKQTPTLVLEVSYDLPGAMAAVSATKGMMWIDKSRRVVVRYETRNVVNVRGQEYTTEYTATYVPLHLNEGVSDSLFVFTPPAGAKVAPISPALPALSVVGTPAQQVVLSQVNGQSFDFGEHRGKITVLTFWASWCEPCVQQMDVIERVWKSLQGKGVVIVGVTEELAGAAGIFLGQRGYTFPSVIDPVASLRAAYRLSGAPSTVIVDQSGRIAARKSGYVGEDELRKLLSDLGAK